MYVDIFNFRLLNFTIQFRFCIRLPVLLKLG